MRELAALVESAGGPVGFLLGNIFVMYTHVHVFFSFFFIHAFVLERCLVRVPVWWTRASLFLIHKFLYKLAMFLSSFRSSNYHNFTAEVLDIIAFIFILEF